MNYKNIKLCYDYVWIVWILVGILHKLIKLKKYNSTSFEVLKIIVKACLNVGLGLSCIRATRSNYIYIYIFFYLRRKNWKA